MPTAFESCRACGKRIDNKEFAVELRKTSRDAPYTVTSIRVGRSGDHISSNR